jgi:hypothetical protein
VRLVRGKVGRRRHVGGFAKGSLRIPDVHHNGIGGFRGAQHLRKFDHVRQRGRVLPLDLELLRGAHCIPLILGHHAKEVAAAYNSGAREILDRAFVDGERRRAGAVGTLAARAYNPAVEHVGDTHVLHVRVGAVDLGGHIHPRHAVLARRLPRRRPGELDIERFVADQLAIAHRAVRFSVDRHDTTRDHQTADLDTEALRGFLQECQAGFGCRRPHLRPAALDRRARTGGALFGRHIGIEPHARKLAHVQVELFTGDLQQPRCVALSQLALAEIKRCGVVSVDCDPGIDGIGIRRAGDLAPHVTGRCGHHRSTGETEADDQRAAGLQKAPAGQRQVPLGRVHGVPPEAVRDATWIAFMIRG